MIPALIIVAVGFAIEAIVAVSLFGQAVIDEADDATLAALVAVFWLAVAGVIAAAVYASTLAERRRNATTWTAGQRTGW